MATIISYGASIDTVKIGRFAGQYAKPRTSLTETRNGITLTTFRGDAVNKVDFNLKDRTPNPEISPSIIQSKFLLYFKDLREYKIVPLQKGKTQILTLNSVEL